MNFNFDAAYVDKKSSAREFLDALFEFSQLDHETQVSSLKNLVETGIATHEDFKKIAEFLGEVVEALEREKKRSLVEKLGRFNLET